MATMGSVLREMRRKWVSYLFISPFFIMFFLFIIGPVGYSFYLSLLRLRGTRGSATYIGLANYSTLLSDSMFWKAIANTFIYTGVTVSGILVLALGLAFLLNSPLLKFKKGFRLIYFFPVMTSLVIAALIFRLILERNAGMVNILLAGIGLPKRNWLGDPSLGLTSLIILGIWKRLGVPFIILLAALQNIPKDIIEAAIVDGASSLKVTGYIILPTLFPVIFFLLIVQSIGALQFFATPYIFGGGGGGGPGHSMLSLALYQYTTGFSNFKFGYASAIAYAMVVLILVFTVVQMKIGGKRAGLLGKTV